MLEWLGKRYMRMQTIRHEERGFTLIELLIVMKRSTIPLRLALSEHSVYRRLKFSRSGFLGSP